MSEFHAKSHTDAHEMINEETRRTQRLGCGGTVSRTTKQKLIGNLYFNYGKSLEKRSLLLSDDLNSDFFSPDSPKRLQLTHFKYTTVKEKKFRTMANIKNVI